MLRALVCAAALAAVSAPALAAPDLDDQQFDLACEGTATTAGADAPEKLRLSIDLHFRVWCFRQNGCEEAQEVRDVNAARIVLRREHDETQDYDFAVNRISGAYTLRRIDKTAGAASTTGRGRCAKAAYTPLPKRAF